MGTLLGNANVNIADFNLGRIPGKSKAISLISVDSAVDAKILDAIDALEQVEVVKILRF